MKDKGEQQQRGRGQTRNRGGGMGPGGKCICPSCGTRAAHKRGFPCYKMSCPQCGQQMIRE